MSESKMLVCLANSRKHQGRCIAGKELTKHGAGEWVRPISPRATHEVSGRERRYDDGSEPRVLDVIRIRVARQQACVCQKENWLIDTEYCWQRIGRLGWNDLAAMEDRPRSLWGGGATRRWDYGGRVAENEARKLERSLCLLHVSSVSLETYSEQVEGKRKKRRVRVNFPYAGTGYRLWVTDPLIEEKYLAKDDGKFPIGECYITVSLSEPFEGFCYKLAAAVISAKDEREP